MVLFKKSWPSIFTGAVTPRSQSGPMSYYTRKQTNQDRVLDGAASATLEELIRWMLAHDFSPASTAEVRINGRTYKLSLTMEEKT